MASRLKERNKYGASLPKPPKCRGNKEPVWVKSEKKKEDEPGKRRKKAPTGGGGKWVCKTKKPSNDPRPDRPPRPRPQNDPDGPDGKKQEGPDKEKK